MTPCAARDEFFEGELFQQQEECNQSCHRRRKAHSINANEAEMVYREREQSVTVPPAVNGSTLSRTAKQFSTKNLKMYKYANVEKRKKTLKISAMESFTRQNLRFSVSLVLLRAKI